MDKKEKSKKKFTDNQNSDLFLKKHVGLIHCENKLTLVQRKICNILLFNALEKINEQDVHEISLRQLCSLVVYNSNDSKLIKESIKNLISVVMEWNLLEDNKFLNEEAYPEEAITWNASSLLAGASIKAGVLRYSYSPQIKAVLSSLDIYGRINLFVQAKFNSSYSLVLYENCVRFKNIKQTAWFPIELFRSLMGVSSDKYPSFKEFKRNVINVGVKEINQKSDIFIDPQFKKSGRNIIAIQFTIRENENYAPTFRRSNSSKIDDTTSQKSSLIEIITSQYNLSEKQAYEIVSTYEYEYIVEKFNLMKGKNNVKHLGAYLLSALKQNFKYNNKLPVKAQRKIEEVSNVREAKAASEIRSLRNKYTAYKLKIYVNFMQQQTENRYMEIMTKFEEFLGSNKEIFRLYRKSKLASPFVRSAFIHFIEEYSPGITAKILSFDDYLISDEFSVETP